MVCPAYHSAFILAEEDQAEFFSNFVIEDSFPDIKSDLRKFMEKNKYGIVVEVSKKKKMKLHDYVPMEAILPLVDSTLMDSTGKIPGAPGYNRDMIVYNRKYGEILAKAEERWEKDAEFMKNQGDGKKKKKKKPKAEDDGEEGESDDEDYWLSPDDEW